MFELLSGENVVYTWSSTEDGETIQEIMQNIRDRVGINGSVIFETYDNLIDVAFSRSLFEVAILDDSHGTQTDISLALLGEYLRILKPCGRLIIRTSSSSDTLLSNLKLAGYYKIIASDYADNLTEIEAHKPDYEIGSNIKLTFHNNKYTLDDGAFKLNLDDPDVQLENPDDLLSEEDLQRPDPSSLKVCGTTGKRKACKSCVCGLKEELDAENEAKAKENKDFKPSCGSCYLGDAFRCASCPYLGMPAFKPGEKVKLTEDTMQDDF